MNVVTYLSSVLLGMRDELVFSVGLCSICGAWEILPRLLIPPWLCDLDSFPSSMVQARGESDVCVPQSS